jgi:DNA primase
MRWTRSLLNRCIVLTVNEDREQTKAIHRKSSVRRRPSRACGRSDDRAEIVKLHRNAQRLLRRCASPTSLRPLSASRFHDRTRRDHMKFLTLIGRSRSHQHQREIKTSTRKGKTLEYIEATDGRREAGLASSSRKC